MMQMKNVGCFMRSSKGLIQWVTRSRWRLFLIGIGVITAFIQWLQKNLNFGLIIQQCRENPLLIYEWSGSLTGLAGAAILASNTRISKYGWWLFLLANVFMIVFAKMGRHDGLLLQQVGFTLTSVLGIVRSSVATSEKVVDVGVQRT